MKSIFLCCVFLVLTGCVTKPIWRQAIAGEDACVSHGGAKRIFPIRDLTRYSVVCEDETEIKGNIRHR